MWIIIKESGGDVIPNRNVAKLQEQTKIKV